MTGVRLSAAVMAHPDRVEHAQRLRDRHPELDLQIVVDPGPARAGAALRTARLAWDAVAPGATHHLVVQDDTLLCGGFRDHLMRAIAAKPEQPISLYAEWGSETSYSVRFAALRGLAWAEVVDHYVPTQALVLPAEMARAFPRFEHSGPHDDFAMRLFLSSLGVAAYMTVPNLAEDARLPSLVGHDHFGERASVCYLAHPDDIDWSGQAAAPEAVPVFAWATGQPYTVARADRPGMRWRRVFDPPPLRYGRAGHAALEFGRATVRQLPDFGRQVGQGILLGLWLTAYRLGCIAADPRNPGDADASLTRPVARRALATMPPGALRFLVDDQQLAEQAGEISWIVETAVCQGFRARAAAPAGNPTAIEEIP